MKHGYSVEWRESEGMMLPFINGLPLCSLRNSEREAEKWRLNQKACDYALVVGIGAGFHLKQLNMSKVLIFDPCEQLATRAQQSYPDLAGRITAQKDILIQYMSKMPAIWIFRPAFNGRLEELRSLEDFLVEQEILVGQEFLQSLNFKSVVHVWKSFPHQTVKFGIHNFPTSVSAETSSFEGQYVDILRELVK